MIQRAILFLLIIVALQSCTLGTSGTWRNESIVKQKKAAISALNERLMQAVKANDPTKVRALMSDKLLEKAGGEIEKLIASVSKPMTSADYRVLDEYDVKNTTTGTVVTLFPEGRKDDNYTISFNALNNEMYASLLISKGTKGTTAELMTVVVYGDYDGEWKINILQFGLYSLFGKTAADFYRLAQHAYAKEYLVDAVVSIGLAQQCLRPGNDILKYTLAGEINSFGEKVVGEAKQKYPLPVTLDKLKTHPQILNIASDRGKDGFYPIVYYLTSINLNDTVALKAENIGIKKEVNLRYKGINKDKDYVFYRAFNEKPDGVMQVKYFTFLDHVNE